MTEKKLVNTKEIAEILGIKWSTVKVYLSTGVYNLTPVKKEGRFFLYNIEDVEELTKNQKKKEQPKAFKEPVIVRKKEKVVETKIVVRNDEKNSIPADKFFGLPGLKNDFNYLLAEDDKIYLSDKDNEKSVECPISDFFNINMGGKSVVQRPINYNAYIGKIGLFDDGISYVKPILEVLTEYKPNSVSPFRTQSGSYYKHFRLLNDAEIIKYCK